MFPQTELWQAKKLLFTGYWIVVHRALDFKARARWITTGRVDATARMSSVVESRPREKRRRLCVEDA